MNLEVKQIPPIFVFFHVEALTVETKEVSYVCIKLNNSPNRSRLFPFARLLPLFKHDFNRHWCLFSFIATLSRTTRLHQSTFAALFFVTGDPVAVATASRCAYTLQIRWPCFTKVCDGAAYGWHTITMWSLFQDRLAECATT